MSKRSKRWCLTWNNYPNNWLTKFDTKKEGSWENQEPKNVITYMCLGEEIGEQGTPHIQGYIELKKRMTLKSLKKWIGVPTIHWEISKGSAQQNIEYCSKDNKVFTTGDPMKQGKRNDLESMVDAIKEGVTDQELIEQHTKTFAKYHKFADRVRTTFRNEENRKKMKEAIDKVELYEWQENALDKLYDQNDREILWIYDKDGNKGKTHLAKWLMVNQNAYYCSGGKSADISYAYDYQETIVFDFTRSQQEIINYSIIESFKNGILFSPKYQSTMKVFAPPKIVCLSNFFPDTEKLSADRWDIMDLSE